MVLLPYSHMKYCLIIDPKAMDQPIETFNIVNQNKMLFPFMLTSSGISLQSCKPD